MPTEKLHKVMARAGIASRRASEILIDRGRVTVDGRPAEVGMRRAASRGEGDRMDNETLEFYERVREAYLRLADRNPGRFVVVDADQTIDDVQRDIERGVARLFDQN